MSDEFVFADPKPVLEPKPDVKQFYWTMWVGVVAVFTVWWLLYQSLQHLANWLTYDLFGLSAGSHLGETLAFFLYDVPKI